MTGQEQAPLDKDDGPADADTGATSQMQSHIAVLRAARIRHKAIGRGLQQYFDAVVAEPIPNQLLNLLNAAEM
jgi:hypothetical protein